MLLGSLSEIFINLYGVVLVMGVVFGLNTTTVLLVTLAIVTVYSYFGSLWTSAITATFNTLLITVPAAVVVLYVLAKAGGADLVLARVHAAGPTKLSVFDPAAAAGFGISLALGLVASTMADQTFWQKVWAMRPTNLNRTFLWAGLWFYPIPLTLGLLGLVGTSLGITTNELGSFGAGAIGPYVVLHLGLPVVLIALYVLIICNACFSSIDGAFSALSSLVAVDIVKRIQPDIPDKRLMWWTKLSIVIAGVVGGIIVSSGLDYVNLVNLVFFIKGALIFPLALAIFWPRMTATAFVASLVLSIAVGLPLRQSGHELGGIVALESVSLVVAVGLSLLRKDRFDYASLERKTDGLQRTEMPAAAPSTAVAPETSS